MKNLIILIMVSFIGLTFSEKATANIPKMALNQKIKTFNISEKYLAEYCIKSFLTSVKKETDGNINIKLEGNDFSKISALSKSMLQDIIYSLGYLKDLSTETNIKYEHFIEAVNVFTVNEIALDKDVNLFFSENYFIDDNQAEKYLQALIKSTNRLHKNFQREVSFKALLETAKIAPHIYQKLMHTLYEEALDDEKAFSDYMNFTIHVYPVIFKSVFKARQKEVLEQQNIISKNELKKPL